MPMAGVSLVRVNDGDDDPAAGQQMSVSAAARYRMAFLEGLRRFLPE